MKNGIKIAMAVMALGLAGLPSVAYAEEEESQVIQISTPQELQNMKDMPEKSYELICDIDMAGVAWEPFSFGGELNGNGYSILNLSVDAVGEETHITYDGNYKEYETSFAGFFTCIEDATITNLNLVNVNVDVDIEDNCFIGSIAGYSENSTISNCTVTGKLSLSVNASNFGVGGVVGYGNGYMSEITANTTMICIDTNAEERDEQFMGGLCAAGYMNMDNCDVTLDGYVSDHGYVHNGGLMGMYFFYPKGTSYYGSITGNKIQGKITFFEDNTDRRAYCKPVVGEYLTYEFAYTGNWESFTNDERFEYNKNLMPDMCDNPEYDVVVTEAVEGAFGYSTHTCKNCGYTYTDNYTIYQDPAAIEPETEESTTENAIPEITQEETQPETLAEGEETTNEMVYKIVIAVVAVMVVITVVMVIVILKFKNR